VGGMVLHSKLVGCTFQLEIIQIGTFHRVLDVV
jgi:hypothetical protein